MTMTKIVSLLYPHYRTTIVNPNKYTIKNIILEQVGLEKGSISLLILSTQPVFRKEILNTILKDNLINQVSHIASILISNQEISFQRIKLMIMNLT